jgi:hypothetical protein
MLAFAAESPAHLIQARAHRPAIVFRRLVIDDDACRGESGAQPQPGNANERRLKAVGQSNSELNPLFAVPRDVDMHQHGCKRSPVRLGAASGNSAFELSHGHESCSTCPPEGLAQRMARSKTQILEMDQERDRATEPRAS